MKVLLTGAGGFIGRHLASALASRHQLLAPLRSQLDLLDDESVHAFLLRERPDAIVHAATTPGHRNAAKVSDLAARNLRMFLALTRAPELFGRFILIGSGSEYDIERMSPRVREEELGRFTPHEPSALSKFTLSRLCEQLPYATVLRPFGVYGPYEDWEIRFISNALCKALVGLPITLRQDRSFDYVYIDDLVALIARLLDDSNAKDRGSYSSYNVTPDASSSLLEIANLARETAARITGTRVDIRVAQAGLGREYSGENSRLRKQFDLPRISISEGIEKLCTYYQANRQLIRPELLEIDK